MEPIEFKEQTIVWAKDQPELMITRRTGLFTLLSMVGGVFQMNKQGTTTSNAFKFIDSQDPTTLTVGLSDQPHSGGFKAVTVTYNGEAATITAKELFEALKESR